MHTYQCLANLSSSMHHYHGLKVRSLCGICTLITLEIMLIIIIFIKACHFLCTILLVMKVSHNVTYLEHTNKYRWSNLCMNCSYAPPPTISLANKIYFVYFRSWFTIFASICMNFRT